MSDREEDLSEGYRNVEVKSEFVREMAQRGGVTALTGPVGTVAFTQDR